MGKQWLSGGSPGTLLSWEAGSWVSPPAELEGNLAGTLAVTLDTFSIHQFPLRITGPSGKKKERKKKKAEVD